MPGNIDRAPGSAANVQGGLRWDERGLGTGGVAAVSPVW
jgi:hypothetical protein